MNLKAKLIGDEDERAVSPVIGVILMVAITVILAAVIAAFVIDLGQSTGANPSAGIAFDQDNETVTVTINSVDRADELWVQCGGDDSHDSITLGTFESAGDSATVDYNNGSATNCGEPIQVVGDYNGNEAVITDYDNHL